MAIIPETRYSGKIDPATSEYPYGSARNITVPGDGTGTPWEAALVNDLFGFQQALLSEASITPSGDPDEVGASQYLAAVQRVSKLEANALADIAALTALTGMVNTQVETVVDEGVFIYDSTLSAVNDGLKVFAGWVRQGNVDQVTFSDTIINTGTTIKTIALADNTHAFIEVYGTGLKGGVMAINKAAFSIYRTTGVLTINRVPADELVDGDDTDTYFDIEASGNDGILKGYTGSGTWAASGTVTVKQSGAVVTLS